MLWMKVPSGMFFNLRALPTMISVASPEITLSPTLMSFGARMYLFSPSAYASKQILAFLFGSYSMVLTVAGTSSLLRLKSIIRYLRLLPPPMWRQVILPSLFLPPVRLSECRVGHRSTARSRRVVLSNWHFVFPPIIRELIVAFYYSLKRSMASPSATVTTAFL